MKSLSVRQPWAWLIANGYKTIETRTKNTHFRGDLLISASKAKMTKAVEKEFFNKYPQAKDDIEYGKAVCIVRLWDCMEMVADHQKAACCPLYDRAKSWFLTDVRKIEPFPVHGQLNLFGVEPPRCNCYLPDGSRYATNFHIGDREVQEAMRKPGYSVRYLV